MHVRARAVLQQLLPQCQCGHAAVPGAVFPQFFLSFLIEAVYFAVSASSVEETPVLEGH